MNRLARLFGGILATVVTALLTVAHGVDQAAQGGDQFLDGIGETSLTARYVLENNAEDSSRNQFHASLRGTANLVEDTSFRRALRLTGDVSSSCTTRRRSTWTTTSGRSTTTSSPRWPMTILATRITCR